MKLTSVLLTALVIHASAIGTAQNVTYSANNVPIEQVFMEIKNQTGYFFLYTESVLKKAKPVTIAANNMPIQQFLEELFENQPLAYTIASRTITVTSTTKVEPNTIHIPDIIALAPFPIKVTDPEGNPLSGATVSIPSKKISGITDAKGEITIEAEAGDVIVVSFIGHQPYRITVTSAMLSASGSYTIALKRAEAELDAVEVTINTGYQHIKPEHSTGSTFTLGRKEYESRINTLNFLDGLQNKIPGLLINNEVQFEGNGLFQIRGISTIKGNRNPLIVLDGYPTELSLDQIDPNDIETVTVLRDAAAATVYGARSSNGVIIIERKKAKAGELRVNFRATTSFRPKEDYSRYRWADNASDIVVEYEKFRNMNALGTVWPGLSGSGGGNRTDNPAALIMLHWRSNTNPISEQERDRQLAELASYNNSSEYSKLFLRTASTQTYNMDMSGGSDRILYFLTANYSHNNAMQVKNDDNIFRISG
ncbi:MAG TPA: TonB-dependent receptor plug domain-containing protein, partial [Parasegetibacter sp.]